MRATWLQPPVGRLPADPRPSRCYLLARMQCNTARCFSVKHRVATPCPSADGSSQALHGAGARHDGRGAPAGTAAPRPGQQAGSLQAGSLRVDCTERQGRGHACCPHAFNPCHARRCKPPRSGPPRTPPRTSSARLGCASSWPPCTASTRRSVARSAPDGAGAHPALAMRRSTAGVCHAACNPQHSTTLNLVPRGCAATNEPS